MRLCLASASSRRRELLRQIGVRFDVYPVDIDESLHPGESVVDYTVRVARDKALAAWQQLGKPKDTVVLGADTCGLLNGEVLLKPGDLEDARRMLGSMSGKEHQILSAVALIGDGLDENCLVTTDVRFRNITREEIDHYWQTGEPQDKAGAYGIQGYGAVWVESINGSYSNVVGLPLAETAALLKTASVPIWQKDS